jgi:WD40 repeat protein
MNRLATPKNKSTPGSDENLKKKIEELQQELKQINEQNAKLFKLNESNSEEINKIKQRVSRIISLLSQKKPEQTKIINQTTKYFQAENLHSTQVYDLIQIEDKRIVTCSEDGSICISQIDYAKKTWNIQCLLHNAHDGAINSLCELSRKRIVSGGDDNLIKVWDCSNQSKLINFYNLIGHNKGIDKIIKLSQDRIASSSSEDRTVIIWKSEEPFKQIQVIIQNYSPISILQLTYNSETMCIACYENSHGYLNFHYLFDSYGIKRTISDVWANSPNGLIELSNGHIVASRGSYPIPCIFVIDPIKFRKVAEIINPTYINNDGTLCQWSKDSFIFANGNCFGQISLINDIYSLVHTTKNQTEQMYGENAIVFNKKEKYLIVARIRGFNIIKYELKA